MPVAMCIDHHHSYQATSPHAFAICLGAVCLQQCTSTTTIHTGPHRPPSHSNVPQPPHSYQAILPPFPQQCTSTITFILGHITPLPIAMYLNHHIHTRPHRPVALLCVWGQSDCSYVPQPPHSYQATSPYSFAICLGAVCLQQCTSTTKLILGHIALRLCYLFGGSLPVAMYLNHHTHTRPHRPVALLSVQGQSACSNVPQPPPFILGHISPFPQQCTSTTTFILGHIAQWLCYLFGGSLPVAMYLNHHTHTRPHRPWICFFDGGGHSKATLYRCTPICWTQQTVLPVDFITTCNNVCTCTLLYCPLTLNGSALNACVILPPHIKWVGP